MSTWRSGSGGQRRLVVSRQVREGTRHDKEGLSTRGVVGFYLQAQLGGRRTMAPVRGDDRASALVDTVEKKWLGPAMPWERKGTEASRWGRRCQRRCVREKLPSERLGGPNFAGGGEKPARALC